MEVTRRHVWVFNPENKFNPKCRDCGKLAYDYPDEDNCAPHKPHNFAMGNNWQIKCTGCGCELADLKDKPSCASAKNDITWNDILSSSPLPWWDVKEENLSEKEISYIESWIKNRAYVDEVQKEARKPRPPKEKPIIKSEEVPVKFKKEPEVTILDVPEHSEPVAEFLRGLNRHVIGQPEAKEVIGCMYERALAGMQGVDRPLGAALLLGQTGCGKTHLVECAAGLMHKNIDKALFHIVKLDCGEFQHSHEIAKLIGSPPGYLGHRETHPLLSQEKINGVTSENCKFSVLLFDEIEKASDAVWKILLGILDRAVLTLGDNRRVDFSRTFVFFTSNLGADILHGKSGRMGLERFSEERDKNKELRDKVRKHFSDEFFNRLDAVVTCQPLTEEQMYQVLELELTKVQTSALKTALEAKRCIGHIRYTDEFKKQIATEGFSREFGVRQLTRVIKSRLAERLSVLLNEDLFPRQGEALEVDWVDGKVVFKRVCYREVKAAA